MSKDKAVHAKCKMAASLPTDLKLNHFGNF